ncbi:MAG: B12-binding domain-containing radical SAM protein [Lachnospiraceae bacterium]|nr:B12-binding domain-containing radical SAM protein [Lachnospiraceae bacterium]
MILLVGINAKYIHSNLGIYCIEAYANEHGIGKDELKLCEYTINQNEVTILADIYENKPDMVAFSCYIWNIEYVLRISRELKKVLPDTDIWCGGPEVSFDTEKLLGKNMWLKGIMSGEGEETFFELAQYYMGILGRELKDIDGISYRDNDVVTVNKERDRMSMDDIVFPYKDIEALKNRIIYYETSRGCPYGCSYCLSSVEKKVRFRSLELVEKELQFFIDNKVKQVKFVDRTFNCNHEHTMAIWKYIGEHDNGITNFHFELSADLLTEDEIALVSSFRPGLVQFEIGVQSTNPDTLRAIHRNHDLTGLKKHVSEVYEGRNIHQHLDLIAGLPYEDYETFRNSFNEVYDMKPDQLQLGFLKVLKGSPIHCDSDKYGIVCQDIPPYEVLHTDWLSFEDILKLKQVEDMVERYYNSMQFEASVKFMVQRADTPFDFFMQIGKFFHDKGYDAMQQSRIGNYEILYEFAKTKLGQEDIKILEQLLIFDLYARENLKKRPEFIDYENGIPDKEFIREFYQNQENVKRFLEIYDGYDWKQLSRMTHIEIFDYDILGFMETGVCTARKNIYIFDYIYRNPLDNQARISKIK